jgi:hypothetical protein
MEHSRRRNAQVFVLALAIPALGYSAFVLLKATLSIAEIAADRPYCVQVSTREGYRRLTTRLQLAGLYMRATEGRYHAVLAVGSPASPVLYHWSYFNSSFVENRYPSDMPLFCEPRPRFLAGLGHEKHRSRRAAEFWRYGYEVSVPDAYSPDTRSGGGSLFSILARAPRFEPGDSYKCPTAPCSYVGVSVGVDAKLESWRNRDSSEARIESLGMESGLIKERVWPAGKRAGNAPTIQYYAMDAKGRTTTLITCFESDRFQCTHIFTDGELSYYFHHMPPEIDHWQNMQQRLVTRVASFLLHRP